MKENTRTLLAIVSVTVLGGMATMLAPSVGWLKTLEFLLTFAISFLVFVWYRIDARERQYQRRWLLNVGIAGGSLLVLPYYLFRSRGAVGGMVAVGSLALLLVGLLLASLVGSLVGLLLRYAAGMPMPPL